MNDSILLSIKKLLGICPGYDVFDTDLIVHINSVLLILNQLGVGPNEGFSICDNSSTWNDFIDNETKLELVKSYTALKVRLLFDPPSSSGAQQAFESMLKELEWRIMVMVDSINR